MWADANSEAEIFAVVDGFLDDVKYKRLEETLARFSGDDDCTLVGSDVGEEAVGPAALKTFFTSMYQRSGSVSFTSKSRRASRNGETAWFCADVEVHTSSSPKTMPYKMACVLVRRGGKWLMQLYHGSEPR